MIKHSILKFKTFENVTVADSQLLQLSQNLLIYDKGTQAQTYITAESINIHDFEPMFLYYIGSDWQSTARPAQIKTNQVK